MFSALPLLRRSASYDLTVRVLQFGQGNFLRAFVDWQIDVMNEGCGLDWGVVIVRPTSRSTAPLLDTQDGLYTTVLQGIDEQGHLQTELRQIACVQRELDLAHHYIDFLRLAHSPDIRFVVSNTTEAGIAVNDNDHFDDRPPSSFPAKLTRWLHARFVHFDGDICKGVIVLPTELIDANGEVLKQCVMHTSQRWQLGASFAKWLEQACCFCSTLVDRIVSGYPQAGVEALQTELGYRDDFMVAGERYQYWAIQAPAWVQAELPLAGAGLNVQWVDDLAPIRLRKVAVLNGAHTVLAALGPLAGAKTVGQAMDCAYLVHFLTALLEEEVFPVLPFPVHELQAYAQDVMRRFRNPSIHHQLAAIALNKDSKFASRLMPHLLAFHQERGHFPARLLLVLAAHVPGLDQGVATVAQSYLARTELWGRDLNALAGFTTALSLAIERLAKRPLEIALRETPHVPAKSLHLVHNSI